MAYDAIRNKNAVKAKLDPGAFHAFLSRAAAKQFNLKISPVEKVEIELGNNFTIK